MDCNDKTIYNNNKLQKFKQFKWIERGSKDAIRVGTVWYKKKNWTKENYLDTKKNCNCKIVVDLDYFTTPPKSQNTTGKKICVLYHEVGRFGAKYWKRKLI